MKPWVGCILLIAPSHKASVCSTAVHLVWKQATHILSYFQQSPCIQTMLLPTMPLHCSKSDEKETSPRGSPLKGMHIGHRFHSSSPQHPHNNPKSHELELSPKALSYAGFQVGQSATEWKFSFISIQLFSTFHLPGVLQFLNWFLELLSSYFGPFIVKEVSLQGKEGGVFLFCHLVLSLIDLIEFCSDLDYFLFPLTLVLFCFVSPYLLW